MLWCRPRSGCEPGAGPAREVTIREPLTDPGQRGPGHGGRSGAQGTRGASGATGPFIEQDTSQVPYEKDGSSSCSSTTFRDVGPY
jgi:hypothetical protein